ncbi:hypothetical protein J437_LFUL001343, partial [Ladona fulva]
MIDAYRSPGEFRMSGNSISKLYIDSTIRVVWVLSISAMMMCINSSDASFSVAFSISDRECEELSAPDEGWVRLTGRLFGDRAVYSCREGLRVVGLATRVCRADGTWSGSGPPQCKDNGKLLHLLYCTVPPTMDHARHNAPPEQATFAVGTTLEYQCLPGYSTLGFPRAKCLAIDSPSGGSGMMSGGGQRASWYGPDITCERKFNASRSCGPPSPIPNGWAESECLTFGCHATYRCADGFQLHVPTTSSASAAVPSGGGSAQLGIIRPASERHCTADGSWAPKELPSCVPVQCPTPENPPNGKAIYTSCSYNSVVSYECKYGFMLVGEPTRRCGVDRLWAGEQPECKEINCGHPGPLYNGWLENIEGGTTLGASIIFRCHEGMRLVGNTSTVCQVDGKWRYPVPQCLAPCVVPSVPHGRVILNGTAPPALASSTSPPPAPRKRSGYTVTVSMSTTTPPSPLPPPVVQHGEVLTVVCEPRYELSHNNSPITCNNGTWTYIPRCQPARCKYLPKAPRNGMVIAPKIEHGMKARFKCKDGYALKGGDNVTECRFGNWTGEMPFCQEVYCPFPGYIDHGKVMLVGNMGLYDYRHYVRKVTNNKQIMYDCIRGYVLAEGPPGATCIGGKWSPKQLPRCVPGKHPRLRWSRSVNESDWDNNNKSSILLPLLYKQSSDYTNPYAGKKINLKENILGGLNIARTHELLMRLANEFNAENIRLKKSSYDRRRRSIFTDEESLLSKEELEKKEFETKERLLLDKLPSSGTLGDLFRGLTLSNEEMLNGASNVQHATTPAAIYKQWDKDENLAAKRRRRKRSVEALLRKHAKWLGGFIGEKREKRNIDEDEIERENVVFRPYPVGLETLNEYRLNGGTAMEFDWGRARRALRADHIVRNHQHSMSHGNEGPGVRRKGKGGGGRGENGGNGEEGGEKSGEKKGGGGGGKKGGKKKKGKKKGGKGKK